MADLRIDAHRQRCLSARSRGQRLVYADWLHGDVHGAGDSVAVPDLSRGRTRTGPRQSSDRRRCDRTVGGTLGFAFPILYASAFSVFYLPLMIVLWLLILRGASIEFRNHIKSAMWDPLWDFLFWGSSLSLAVFFGAALGNVVRGVPLDSSGYFFEPLWTNFRLGDETGILD